MIKIESAIKEHLATIENITEQVETIRQIGMAFVNTIQNGGKIIWMGNGGSAADSQHLAAELVGRFEIERPGYPSIALTTDSSILTAVANDFGFERIFERQIESLCHSGDVVVGLSTSGNSPNILKGLQMAGKVGAITVGFTGIDGGALPDLVQHMFRAQSSSTPRIQEAHIFVGHMLCQYVEEALA